MEVHVAHRRLPEAIVGDRTEREDERSRESCPLSVRPFVGRARIHSLRRRFQVHYATLIHEKPGSVEALAEDEQKAVFAEHTALAEDPRARGGAIEVRPLVER